MKQYLQLLVQRWNRLDESWRFAILAFAAARLTYGLWSLIILAIQPLAVQNIELSGEPIVTVFNLRENQGYVYLREINGQIHTFRPAGRETMGDQQTGSIWDISNGVAIQGLYKDQTLPASKTVPSDIFPYFGVKPFSAAWLSIWQRFDVNWFLSLAEYGYGNIVADAHFPPLYPALIRLARPFFGNAFLAGLFISHLAAFFSIKLLYDLFVEWGGRFLAMRASAYFLLFPAAFFLFTAYSESLFILTVLLSLRAMKGLLWGWAGFWAFCAILIRLQGTALLAPMIYLMWKDTPLLRRLTHWIALSLPTFSGAFYLYLRSLQRTSEIIPIVETDLRTRIVPPWQGYWNGVQAVFSNQYSYIELLNLVIATLFLVLLIMGWRRIPLEYNLFTTFNFIIILSRITETQPLTGMSRFALTLFPSFFVLGMAGENPIFRRMIIYTFLPLNLYLSAQFFLWGWVA